MPTIKPMVCAVCNQVLDRHVTTATNETSWIHFQEMAGNSDHIAVPVQYDEVVEVVTRCDFCYRVVHLSERWTVPAENFTIPVLPGQGSSGHWAADATCARLAAERDWPSLIMRHLTAPDRPRADNLSEATYRWFLTVLYDALAEHMTGTPRPWQAGDEQVTT